MSSRHLDINFPEFKREVQLPLFGTQDETKFKYNWPKWERGFDAIESIISSPDKLVGLDLEFDSKSKRCSILGVSNRNVAASGSFDKSQAKEIISGAKEGKYKLVGFSVNGAEKSILEHNLDEELPLDIFEDTMLLFHLCNSHLTKSSQGKIGYEKNTLGFINLWTCASLYTNLPQWKVCRELTCSGPCPRHDVWGYNAIDSWAGLEAFYQLLDEAKKYGLSYEFYRDIFTLSEIAQNMQENGIRVDRKKVKELDNLSTEEKDKLFEQEDLYTPIPFNPNSSQEAMKFFKEEKIKVEDYTKNSLIDAIKKLATKSGLDYEEYMNSSDLPKGETWLIKAAQYKGLGKGLKGWFGDRYFDGDCDVLHPRNITTGTQTGRWANSRPNFQNIPAYKDD